MPNTYIHHPYFCVSTTYTHLPDKQLEHFPPSDACDWHNIPTVNNDITTDITHKGGEAYTRFFSSVFLYWEFVLSSYMYMYYFKHYDVQHDFSARLNLTTFDIRCPYVLMSSTIFAQTKFVSSIYIADVMQVSGVLTFSKEFVSFGFDYFSNKEVQYNSSTEIAALKVILLKELRTLKTCD